MLQQTTVKAVLPYYQRFLEMFPNIESLAGAGREEVCSVWTGLGYYSRAENLLKSAKIIGKSRAFPQTAGDLLKLPGFGPYTSRAVSSLAFGEPVGVLDGNVIRFLTRFHGLSLKWWTGEGRKRLQSISDNWVKGQNPSHVNQALMEQGALICSPKPLCLLCSVNQACKAFKQKTQDRFPRKRERKPSELLHWRPLVLNRSSKYGFIKNTDLPFLKNRPVFPGAVTKVREKPKKYDFHHSITRYKIYVTLQKEIRESPAPLLWISGRDISKHNPSSLIQKILRAKSATGRAIKS